MKGLTASCFAILCLALASGAPDKNDGIKFIIHPRESFTTDVVYGVCEDSDDPQKKCKVYQESFNPDQNTKYSCEINLELNEPERTRVHLFNVGFNKAIFVIHNSDYFSRQFLPLKLINVNLSGCNVTESSIDLGNNRDMPQGIAVVPREKDYDLVFRNVELCGDLFCKATYDYDGNIIKAASRFGVKYVTYDTYIISINKGYLISEYQQPSKIAKVYFLQDGILDGGKTLFQAPGDRDNRILLSKEENKLGFCMVVGKTPAKLECMQYDAEAKSKIVEAQVTLGRERYGVVDVLNLEKGLLAAMVKITEPTAESLEHVDFVIVPIDEQGKQRNFIKFDYKCDLDSETVFNRPKLYKNSIGENCFSYVCETRKEIPLKFSRITNCYTNEFL